MIICDKAKESFWEITLKKFVFYIGGGGSRPKQIDAIFSCSRAKILQLAKVTDCF